MRVQDWPDRLIAVLDADLAKAFQWGETDCMQLAMRCAEAVTGEHPYPKAKGYKTQKGAMACLGRHGFATVVEALAAKYPAIPVAMARRGDLGVIPQGEGFCALVCDGAAFVGKAIAGNIRVPRDAVVEAFKVG